MGETCPTGEESDGEGMEDREGVTVRGAEDVASVDWTELGATDPLNICTGVVAAKAAEDVSPLACTVLAIDGVESTEEIGGWSLGVVEAGS